METFWFIALSLMLTIYVILDGFDLGAGIIHLFAAKTENDRKQIISAIGPYWDGNEVWLIAGGGTLFFAFPKMYAASFSGFYLPLTILLWLLIGRAIGIELRKHVDNDLWRKFWDVIFSVSSILIVIFLGAALGNVIRGVPLDEKGNFFEPLWTTFTLTQHTGILDWFTILMALLTVSVLTYHGSVFIAMKTNGDLSVKSKNIALKLVWFIIGFSLLAIFSISFFKLELWNNYFNYPVGFIFPVLGLLSIIISSVYLKRELYMRSFIASGLFIAFMLLATAYGLYPVLLPSTLTPLYDLTIQNSSAGQYGLHAGIWWWIPGFILAVIYFWFLFYKFRGKVNNEIY